jgi:hypothetical protein
MSFQRRSVRLVVLALLATALSACHFHPHPCGPSFRIPVRHCR